MNSCAGAKMLPNLQRQNVEYGRRGAAGYGTNGDPHREMHELLFHTPNSNNMGTPLHQGYQAPFREHSLVYLGTGGLRQGVSQL
eukprot:5598206-Amphidinium_carterae.3